jgi:flagellar biosynthesis protein
MERRWWTCMRDDRRTLQAAALGYDRGRDQAPRILAKGGGDVAKSILAAAEQHGVPVERDPDLLQCLQPLAVGREVPVAAYEAVARILAFLYAQNAGNGAAR